MKTLTFTRLIPCVVLALVASPAVAQQFHPRHYDQMELFARVGADQARDLHQDVVRHIYEPELRRAMTREIREVMVGYTRLRAYARQERADRMDGDIARVDNSLHRLEAMADDYTRHQGWDRGGELQHIHRVIHSLTDRIHILDDMSRGAPSPPPPSRRYGYRS